jgi:hypothetical protein
MRLSPPRPGRRPPRRGGAPPGRRLRTAVTGLAVAAAALAVIVLAAGPPASAGTGGVLAAKTIGQVISSTTAWIVGILAGGRHLVPDHRGAEVSDGRRRSR